MEKSEEKTLAGVVQPCTVQKAMEIGDATLKIAIDGSSVDQLIGKMERSLAAFKAEWNR